MDAGEGLLRPVLGLANHGNINQLAAFGELVQDGVQLAQILARQPRWRARRRRGVNRGRGRLGRGRRRLRCTMNGAVGRLDARHRRALQRRLAARLDIVATVAEIAADQRREPAAEAAPSSSSTFGFRRCRFVGKLLVFARAMRRLRRALLPNDLRRISRPARARCAARRGWCSPRRKADGGCRAEDRRRRDDNSAARRRASSA